MKKFVLFALLGSFALSLVAGCSGGAAEKEALEAKDQGKTGGSLESETNSRTSNQRHFVHQS